MSKTNYTSNELEDCLLKLLQKAGKNPKCTLKLLRHKAEERLNLQKDVLKSKSNEIKDIIMKWYNEEEAKENALIKAELTAYAKFAKAVGYAPAIFKGIKEMTSQQEQLIELLSRFKEKGHNFTTPPTEAEIEAAKKEYELKKEMAEIDPSLIIEGNRKRKASEMESSSGNNNSSSSGSASGSGSSGSNKEMKTEVVRSKHNLDANEEADF